MKKRKVSYKEVDTNTENLPMVMEAGVAYVTNPAISTQLFQNSSASISSILGKSNKLPQSIDSAESRHQYISIIREGVKVQALESLMENTSLTSPEMASILHTSERTLRRYTSDTVLNPEQTERIVELAWLYTRGAQVFSSLERFKTWMDSNILVLGNIKPKALLDTSLGIEILQEELGRIEHGVFA